MSAWTRNLYAFVPSASVGAFLDFLAPRLLEGDAETYVLNRYQYSTAGTQPYEYAMCEVPLPDERLDEFLAAFADVFATTRYYVVGFISGLVTHTNSGTVTVGSSLTRAGAISDAMVGKSLIAAPAQIQGLATVYDIEPISNDITSGGNGGTVIVVSTLADSGIGSLRYALTRTYPRHVVFEPGLHGTIHLQSTLTAAPDLTLDARNHGICIAGGQFEVGDDTIIVNMRMRNGVVNYAGEGYIDCLSVAGDNVYLKNCSITHGADSNLEILGANVYTEACLIAQGMDQYNKKGINVTQGGGYFTGYRNVVAFIGDRVPTMFSGMRVDILNCLMVNNGLPVHVQPRDSETKLNLINNRVAKGNMSGGTTALIVRTVNNPSEPNVPAYIAASGLYMAGNVNVSAPGATQEQMREMTNDGTNVTVVETAYTALHVDLGDLVAADAAMETDVLAEAGAFPRDVIDQQIIDDIASRATVLFPETLDYPDLTALFD